MRKQSDSETLEQLYDLYEQKMYAVAFSILHNEWQAEDAVQDAFVRLFKNIRRLKKRIWKQKRHGHMFCVQYRIQQLIYIEKII